MPVHMYPVLWTENLISLAIRIVHGQNTAILIEAQNRSRYDEFAKNLQGGAKFPTGGTLRNPVIPVESVKLRQQQLKSGWKKSLFLCHFSDTQTTRRVFVMFH